MCQFCVLVTSDQVKWLIALLASQLPPLQQSFLQISVKVPHESSELVRLETGLTGMGSHSIGAPP